MAEPRKPLTGEQYRRFLTECVRAAGQMIIDNATDIVGNTDNISDLSIECIFDRACDSIPGIRICRSHFPKREVIQRLTSPRTRYGIENPVTDRNYQAWCERNYKEGIEQEKLRKAQEEMKTKEDK